MNNSVNKIIDISEFRSFINSKTVLCYGHFSIIHPGHVRYLNHGSTRGDILLALVRGDEFENDTQKNILKFPENDRAEGLAALSMLDQVIKQKQLRLVDAVGIIKPDVFLLGREFEENPPKDIAEAIRFLRDNGCVVEFHAGETSYSVSDLNIEKSETETRRREQQLLQSCKKQNIRIERIYETIEQFKGLSLLVVGDTIVDQYIACDALGMSAEAPVVVLRELEHEVYLGGAAIVAAHVRSLQAKCHYISVVGEDELSKEVTRALDEYHVSYDLVPDASRPTTFKTRYMVENQKMFRVSRLKEHSLYKDIESQVIEKIRNTAPTVDGILVSDFVYGMISPRILAEITRLSELYGLRLFGDLQCSSQVGSVLKFRNFDLICPTEREARISLGNKDDGIEVVANNILAQTACKNMLLKLGANGFISYSQSSNKETYRQHFPALNPNPLDVAGAGDSLLAAMAVALCSKMSLNEASFFGAFVAANTVSYLGNKPVDLEKTIERMRALTA
jgi:rfaE bifunctional protein kinase chain/domain